MPAQVQLLLFGALLLVFLVVIVRQRQRLSLLEVEARHDVLTGLPNRRALVDAWQRLPAPRALILIDLVGFKAVNDSHGHIVGDALLQKVAARLREAVPAPGLIARWGGDEFAALLPAHMADGLDGVLADAWARPYDLTARGGPAEVRIGGRIGLSVGEAQLERALDSAARGLLEAKAAA